MGSANYMLGVYIAVPLTVIVTLLVLLLCYICCKRRFRLNWYERTLLDGLEKGRTDSEKDFLHRPTEEHSRSLSSLDRSGNGGGIESLKQGLPNITIGHGSANVVTRKVKQQQQEWDTSSMGSTNSSPRSDHSPVSSDCGFRGAITPCSQGGPTVVSVQHEKRVSFSSGGTGTGIYPANMSRRSSMTAAPPIILPASGRRGSTSGSTGSGDGRRDSAEFWVPPTVLQKKRAQSLVPSLGLFQQSLENEDLNESVSSRENKAVSQPDMVVVDTLEKHSLDESVSMVQVPAAQRGRRRASMQDALDPNLINARIYEQAETRQHRSSIGSIQEEDIGLLNIGLEYDPDQAILKVRLNQARGLVPRDFSGTSDPYCRVSLLPNRKHFLQTRVHKNTQNPEFEEEFMFSAPPNSIAHRTLQVLVYDFDQFSRDECIGQVLVPLDTLDLREKQDLWRSIATYESSEETEEHGDIMFSLGYLPSAERLTVVILKARNMCTQSADSNAKHLPNPFVKVSIISNEKRIKKKKTASIRNSGNPVWNEALVFNINKNLLKQISLDINVYSDNVIGNNELLGKVVIGPDSSHDERAHWNDMLNSKNAMARWHKLNSG